MQSTTCLVLCRNAILSEAGTLNASTPISCSQKLPKPATETVSAHPISILQRLASTCSVGVVSPGKDPPKRKIGRYLNASFRNVRSQMQAEKGAREKKRRAGQRKSCTTHHRRASRPDTLRLCCHMNSSGSGARFSWPTPVMFLGATESAFKGAAAHKRHPTKCGKISAALCIFYNCPARNSLAAEYPESFDPMMTKDLESSDPLKPSKLQKWHIL